MTVSACSTVKPDPVVVAQVIRPELPASARKKCDDPVKLPDRMLPAEEATPLWAKDRAALRVCETRRGAAVAAVDAAPVPDPRPLQ